jgi:hypothetical protein
MELLMGNTEDALKSGSVNETAADSGTWGTAFEFHKERVRSYAQ